MRIRGLGCGETHPASLLRNLARNPHELLNGVSLFTDRANLRDIGRLRLMGHDDSGRLVDLTEDNLEAIHDSSPSPRLPRQQSFGHQTFVVSTPSASRLGRLRFSSRSRARTSSASSGYGQP